MAGIGERIKTVRGSLSREKFSTLTGISKTALVNYETGDRTPSADYLVKILEMFPDLSPAWLLTGEDPMIRGGSPKAAPGMIDEELLKDAIQAVEEYLAEIKGLLTPEKKAQMVMLLCQWHLKEASGSRKINKATVIKLVRLAV